MCQSSQQFFSHVSTSLPRLNQYIAADKVFFSRTQHSDAPGCEDARLAWIKTCTLSSSEGLYIVFCLNVYLFPSFKCASSEGSGLYRMDLDTRRKPDFVACDCKRCRHRFR